jgi:hypothetical protein
MVAAVPIKRQTLLIIGLVAAMVAIVAVVVVVIASGSAENPAPPPRHAKQMPEGANTVEIEVRAKPRATISFDGHNAGTTPLVLHVPRSTSAIEITAVLIGHTRTKTVTPDHDQTIDFTYP